MQNTTFHQQNTTTSPQKAITQTPLFSKIPCKNATPPQTKKSGKKKDPAKARPPLSIRSYPRKSAVDYTPA
jgi:hypothetical protein